MDNPKNQRRKSDEWRQERSAPKPGHRGALTNLIEQVKAGSVQAIYVWRPDRLARVQLAGQSQSLEADLVNSGMHIVVCDRTET